MSLITTDVSPKLPALKTVLFQKRMKTSLQKRMMRKKSVIPKTNARSKPRSNATNFRNLYFFWSGLQTGMLSMSILRALQQMLF